MQLVLREAARLLNVSEETIYRWIAEDGLPAYRVNEQYRFNKADLLEWVTSHKGTRRVSISPEIFRENHSGQESLAEALERGGIHHGLEGGDADAALRAIIGTLPLPPGVDRQLLFQILQAREALGSTGTGDGIAIPHVRNPLVLGVSHPAISLCSFRNAIDFRAPDRKPVHTFFAMIAPTVRAHLHLLSRLAAALNDPAFKAAVVDRKPAAEIVREAKRLERVPS